MSINRNISWVAFALSFVGMILNAHEIIWCWPVWISAACIWIYVSFKRGDKAMTLTWIVFLCSNVYGWIQWR